ncbi:energy-coupling factor transporter transmembrane component T family protein [Geoalkalibacter halelectricus]|uniref:Energy-coupling factor transporter transmembrane protein EcfT n=1 Tax=Geoalkalibacter halelectricus TaxID=2847045 RepID=A0ABY5ZHS9_9BACT|nr:energy-coupling factor transporter transmembrane protein EcfT [Geoalkalibacter halelectricus]MDO3379418.1 energy-coupling factor transporter transmembrane protein EcfT [Geoalkalibacter halelectricus]UWZ78705.1 energy-coupling factor transporter transmembrane protein EcfT [Geoalkalibacter halelectricus]
MSVLDDLILGRYEPGDSLLHRFDAPLKLVLVLVLVICAFSVARPTALVALSTLALTLVACSGVSWRLWWRGLRVFRWLFLFTLVLHVLFSPGRTLWGMAFLSYDGLLQGLRVVWQLGLAVVFSSLLTLTTSPARIALAFVTLASPLQSLRIPVARGGEFILLTLHFLPLLREELVVARAAESTGKPGIWAQARQARDQFAPVLVRLADRAEELAVLLARGEALPGAGPPEEVKTLPRWQNWALFGCAMLLPLYLLGTRLWPTFA